MQATILSGTPGIPGRYLKHVQDPDTGQYLVPFSADAPPPNPVGPEMTVAVLDSGLLLEHPGIKGGVRESVDFTGEGPNDFNGHGTVCGLLLRCVFTTGVSLINVKALAADGRGDPSWLVQAIKWCVEQKVAVVNMSCGVYTPRCRGDCVLCETAAAANGSRTLVIAAAGNARDTTACPARLAVYREGMGYAVGAHDFERGVIADYSGRVGAGGTLGDVYAYESVPYREDTL